MNKVILKGRLGRAPEVVDTKGKSKLVVLSVATDKTFTNKETNERTKVTTWHKVNVWGNTGDVICRFFDKGSDILIEAELRYSEYEKNGVKSRNAELDLLSWEFCGSTQQPQQQQQQYQHYQPPQQTYQPPQQRYQQPQQQQQYQQQYQQPQQPQQPQSLAEMSDDIPF